MAPDDTDRTELPTGPTDLIDPDRWARLDEYFAGRLPLADRIEMDRWAAAREDRQKLVEQLRHIWERAAKAAPTIGSVDIRQVLNVLAVKREAMDAAAAVRSARIVARLEFGQQTDASYRPRIAPTRRRSGRFLARVTAVAAAVILAVGLPFLSHHFAANPSEKGVKAMREIVTRRGQQAALDLADGSRVVLAADSRLRIPIDFDVRSANGVRRELYLDGKAYFKVQHDSTRPFIVHTATATTEDVGTEFVVNAYNETHATKVAVLSGSVALRRPLVNPSVGATRKPDAPNTTPLMLLRAGDVARLDSSGTATVARGIALTSYVSWTQGVLAFDGTLLRDGLAELSRWYDVDFAVPDNVLDTLRVTGEFRDEPIDQAVQRLALMLDMRATRIGRTVTLSNVRARRALH
jgi:ferric-dicitrate binding protein FerR (iron transport regulator)